MARPDYKDILIKLKNGEICNDDIDRILADGEKETRGRPKKILLEDPMLAKLKKEVGKAKRAWVIRALWLRMDQHIMLAKTEKKKIINEYCRIITDKVLEVEITIANKLNNSSYFVIKLGFDSVIIGTDKDFEVAKFGDAIGTDPLSNFYRIDSGVSVPASLETLKVFVSRSIFLKFRKSELVA